MYSRNMLVHLFPHLNMNEYDELRTCLGTPVQKKTLRHNRIMMDRLLSRSDFNISAEAINISRR